MLRPTDKLWEAYIQTLRKTSSAPRNDPAVAEALHQQYEALEAAATPLRKQFIAQMPQSRVSLDLLCKMASPNLDLIELGPLFDGLAPAVRQSSDGQAFATRLHRVRQTAVSAAAPTSPRATPVTSP